MVSDPVSDTRCGTYEILTLFFGTRRSMVQIHSPRPLHSIKFSNFTLLLFQPIVTGFRCESCDTLRNI